MGLFSELASEWDDMQNPFYPVEPEILFQAAVIAGGTLKWTVQQADGASRTITFVATKTHLLSSTSQGLFSVFIVPEEVDGVSGARLRSAGRAGDPDSFGEGVTNEFGAAVNGGLMQLGVLKDGEFVEPKASPRRTEPLPSTGKNPFSSKNPEARAQGDVSTVQGLASELGALTELHKTGALTDAEFSAAKKKLIG